MPTLSTSTRRSWPVLIATALITGASGLPPAMAADFITGYSYQLGVSGTPDRAGQQRGPAAAGQRLLLDESSEFRNGALFNSAKVSGWSSASNGHLQATLRADAAMSTQTALQAADIRAEMTSALSDTLVVGCPTCTPGTLGWMNFRVFYDGVTSGSGHLGQPPGEFGRYSADTTWQADVLLQADGVPYQPPDPGGPPWPVDYDVVHLQYFLLETRSNGGYSISQPPHTGSGMQDLWIQFVFGQPIHLDLRISASTITTVVSDNSNAPFSGSATSWIDLSRSLYWDGVIGVQNADEQYVTGYTVSGAGGLDYRQSFAAAAVVPEPGTWALMLAGLGALGALVRRRGASSSRGS